MMSISLSGRLFLHATEPNTAARRSHARGDQAQIGARFQGLRYCSWIKT